MYENRVEQINEFLEIVKLYIFFLLYRETEEVRAEGKKRAGKSKRERTLTVQKHNQRRSNVLTKITT
jgi:hypothetical protein